MDDVRGTYDAVRPFTSVHVHGSPTHVISCVIDNSGGALAQGPALPGHSGGRGRGGELRPVAAAGAVHSPRVEEISTQAHMMTVPLRRLELRPAHRTPVIAGHA